MNGFIHFPSKNPNDITVSDMIIMLVNETYLKLARSEVDLKIIRDTNKPVIVLLDKNLNLPENFFNGLNIKLKIEFSNGTELKEKLFANTELVLNILKQMPGRGK